MACRYGTDIAWLIASLEINPRIPSSLFQYLVLANTSDGYDQKTFTFLLNSQDQWLKQLWWTGWIS
ncbi:unnamed protein product [Sphenostylis stenocarpa]|uniref:Uncharacterized protein n=1 Tax=Sphenostylis stenocarpa TaxID=92480 RepID=A0AA86V0X0_9FABA|nr:unnamed protein product [Sphenostylis stenocarpa]